MTPAAGATRKPSMLGRVLVAAALFPLAIGVAGAVRVWLWTDELPAQIAIHWSYDGVADGFAPAASVGWLDIGIGVIHFIIGAVLASIVSGHSGISRAVAGTLAGSAGLFTAMNLKAVDEQRNLGGADLSWWLVLEAAVVCAIVATLIVPNRPDETESGDDETPRHG